MERGEPDEEMGGENMKTEGVMYVGKNKWKVTYKLHNFSKKAVDRFNAALAETVIRQQKEEKAS